MTAERHFLRDPGLLDSAMARPKNAFAYGEEDEERICLWRRGYCRARGLAQAHAFEQGNKRTFFVAMNEFLMINGHELAIDDTPRWADEVIALVEHRSTEDDFARAIRPFAVAK
jgi:death on curing protein